MFENLQRAVQAIADEMTIKADYTDELKQLEAIEGDIAVMRRLGVPVWKCTDLREKINQIREWIKEETANT
jgi:hypothetical protein